MLWIYTSIDLPWLLYGFYFYKWRILSEENLLSDIIAGWLPTAKRLDSDFCLRRLSSGYQWIWIWKCIYDRKKWSYRFRGRSGDPCREVAHLRHDWDNDGLHCPVFSQKRFWFLRHPPDQGGDSRGDRHLRKDSKPHHPEAEGKRHGRDHQGEVTMDRGTAEMAREYVQEGRNKRHWGKAETIAKEFLTGYIPVPILFPIPS